MRTEIASLKPGEISKPLRSPFGWQIVKLNERKAEGVRSMGEVRDAIVKALRDARIKENTTRYLESIKTRDPVTLDDKGIADITKN